MLVPDDLGPKVLYNDIQVGDQIYILVGREERMYPESGTPYTKFIKYSHYIKVNITKKKEYAEDDKVLHTDSDYPNLLLIGGKHCMEHRLFKTKTN